jgi:hypothetical protein
MYKILIHIITQSRDKWIYYQEDGADYISDSLEAMKETVLSLIDIYGEDDVKIVDQVTGDGPDGTELYIYDATDDYEELEHRPYINDVEIIGRLSLADLGIQPEGDYAVNERVDDIQKELQTTIESVETEIHNRIGDLADLQTVENENLVSAVNETYDMINMLASTDQHITGLQTFSVLPETSLLPNQDTQFTNKQYVDTAIANIDYSNFYETDEIDKMVQYYKMPLSVYNASATPTEAEMADLQTIVDYYLENGRIPAIMFYDMLEPGYTYIIWGVPGRTELNPNVTRLTWNGAAYYTYNNGEDGYIKVGRQSWYITYNVNTNRITTTRLQKSGEMRDEFTVSSDKDLKEYIDAAIAAIPEIDLTPYATTEYVDEAIAAIPEVDLTPYATKEALSLLDEKAAQSIIHLYVNQDLQSGTSIINIPDEQMDYVNERAVEIYNKYQTYPIFAVTDNKQYTAHYIYKNVAGVLGETWGGINFVQVPVIMESPHNGALYSTYSILYATINPSAHTFLSLSVQFRGTKYFLSPTNKYQYTPSSAYNPATKKYVDDSIVSAIGDIVSFGVELVDELPTENISTSTVYMVPSTKTEEQNVKDEYLYTGTEWELIGTTKVDLSNYYNKQEVDEMMDNVMTKITVATDEEVYNLLHGGAV